ncbi:MAG: response regulator transcription factor [Coriobacteriales bacterium]|jgi:DNA-binding NarL/FixJ family response regulator|nr:response regulator transcription factor [Coriobacteriales bacterium]
MTIRVLLADDDALVLEGLAAVVSSFPDIELIGTATGGRQALKLARDLHPDVAVLDIRMPDIDGIRLSAALLAEGLAAPLLLTTFDEAELIIKALEAGACGYVLKNSPVARLHSAIVTVAAGGTVFSPDILDFIRGQVHQPSGEVFARLTEREREVVSLVAAGLSNEQIAERLVLAHGTVRNHISTILEKTGLEHRTQIAVSYYQQR